jgi:hypothetical protein
MLSHVSQKSLEGTTPHQASAVEATDVTHLAEQQTWRVASTRQNHVNIFLHITMITTELIEKVLAKAQETASHSWEYSTVFEALLEYRDPARSIFHDPFPEYEIPVKSEDLEAVRYVRPFIRTDSTTLCEGNGKPTTSCTQSSSIFGVEGLQGGVSA